SDGRLGSRVSAVVLDAGTGQVLLDRGSGNLVIPASTAKLATSVALLAVTKPDQRLTTTVVAGTKPGEVVLVGGGDATLSEAPAGQVAVAEGQPAGFTGAAAATRAVLGRLGLPAGGDKLVDGSGLSLQDRVTPALLAGLLRVAAGPADPRLHALVPGLPVSG